MNVLLNHENKIAEIRKHPFYFYTETIGLIILAVAPLFVFRIFSLLISWNYPAGEVISFLIFVYSLFLSVVLILFFIFWTDYFVDVWIVTDSRIVDFELKGLFHKDVASVRLGDIQDVKVVVTGFVESWLKIGDLHVQTAGIQREFILKGASEPEKMKIKIMQAIDAHHKQKNSTT